MARVERIEIGCVPTAAPALQPGSTFRGLPNGVRLAIIDSATGPQPSNPPYGAAWRPLARRSGHGSVQHGLSAAGRSALLACGAAWQISANCYSTQQCLLPVQPASYEQQLELGCSLQRQYLLQGSPQGQPLEVTSLCRCLS